MWRPDALHSVPFEVGEAPVTRTCIDCGVGISRFSKTGRCHPCASRAPEARARKGKLSPEQRERRAAAARALSADPAIIAKRAAKAKETYRRPEVKARHRAACLAAQERMDPEVRERQRASGRAHGAANLASTRSPESRARAGAAIRRTRMAWCPEAYWPLADRLKRAGIRLDERKRMIAEQIAVDERARLAAMTPFERQLARVAAGAKLVEVTPLRRSDPDYTLGGVSSSYL